MPKYLPKEFKNLETFLSVSYFDEDVFTLEEYKQVARDFARDNGYQYCLKVIQEGKSLLKLTPFPAENIQDACNRTLGSATKTKEWLHTIIAELENELASVHPEQ